MERIGDGVRGALRSVGVPDTGVLADVTRVWAAAVGPAIARSAWPLRLTKDGTLVVATESAVWARELTLLAPELRVRLVEALGTTPCPEQFRFAVGPVPAPGIDHSAPPPARPHAGPEEDALAAAVASAISDPELRELVRRAAAASLAKRRDGRSV